MFRSKSAKMNDLAHQVARDVGLLAGSSETEFLAIGENLRDFFDRAMEISEEAGSVAGRMTGEDLATSAGRLQNLTGRMNNLLEGSAEKMSRVLETLRRIVSELRSSSKSIRDYDNIIKYLKVLGVCTKIETAHLRSGNQDFLFLAEEVDRQSAIIRAKTERIRERSDVLLRELDSTLSRFQFTETDQRRHATEMIENIGSCLESLRDKQGESAEIVVRISEKSEDVVRGIGEVVSSMQFHDIVRQQLEHVRDVLGQVENGWEAEEVRAVCELEAAQLKRSRRDLITAVEKVADNLAGIAGAVDEMSLDIQAQTGSSGSEGRTFLLDLEEHMASAAQALNAYETANRELAPSMTAAASMLREMNSFLKDVTEIGETIKYIALNATIKAARLGGEGAALDALANEIRRLSQEAGDGADAISQMVAVISEAARDLRGHAESGGDRSEVDGLMSEITGMMASLRRANEGTTERLTRMNRLGRGLIEEIGRTVAGITVHHRFEEELGRAIASLESVVGPESVLATRPDLLTRFGGAEGLSGLYTMESEREIHSALVDQDEAGVELFEDFSSASNKEKSRDKDPEEEDLGDNVELF